MKGYSTPFFSVIIPVYNRATLVATTIQTVLDQQFRNFELIIVDDGSTDDTAESVQYFTDARIKYIRIENSERGVARNTGAQLASGTYLNFFDSDDLMYVHHLQAAFSFIQQHGHPKWFHVGYDIYDEHGKQLVCELGVDNPEAKLIETNYLGCDSVFIQRELFMAHRFCEDKRVASSEDWELWLRVISEEKLSRCPVVTFRMTHHSNRSLLTISPDRIVERDSVMLDRLMQQRLFREKFKAQLRIFEADRYTFFALNLVLAKRRTEAIAWLWRSLRATPAVLTRRRFWACVKLLSLSLIK